MLFKLIDYLGYYGPIILLLTSIFLLRNKNTFLVYYIFGYIINIIINMLLKYIIKNPRPDEDLSIFNASKTHGVRNMFDKYGMPSGHIQNLLYSIVFIYYTILYKTSSSSSNFYIISCYILITLNTCYQRVKYKNHTILQVIIGGICGSIIGYLFYYMSSKKITGILKYKLDDNAPI